MHIEAEPSLERAHKFYQKMGFNQVEVEKKIPLFFLNYWIVLIEMKLNQLKSMSKLAIFIWSISLGILWLDLNFWQN